MVNDRAFGIEIEFKGSRSSAAAQISALGVACQEERYNHNTRSHWKIVTDASLGYDNAGEVVSPILRGEQGLRELELVCQGLANAGCTVDRSCGLHVHLDARDMTVAQIKRVFDRYADFEHQIDLIMPPSRRGNARWCQSIAHSSVKNSTFQTKASLGDAIGRYHKVNLTNIAGRGSIEFRQHSGTTDYGKISNWLFFLQQFVDASIRLETQPQRRARQPRRSFGQFRDYIESKGHTVSWARGRNAWVINGPSLNGPVLLTREQVRGLYEAETTAQQRKHSGFFQGETLMRQIRLHAPDLLRLYFTDDVEESDNMDSGIFHLIQTQTQQWFANRREQLQARR